MTRFLPLVSLLGTTLWIGGVACAANGRDAAVYEAVEASRAGALDLLKTIVDIDSGSGDVSGGERVLHALAPHLEAAGAKLEYHPAEAAGLPPNLVATFRGSGKSRILIIAHFDTVFGPGTARKRPFTVNATRAHGAGVGDEKAGIVNAVMALQILHERHFDRFGTITLLLDSSEELGSPGSTELIKSLARHNDVAFNMEPGDPPDALTVWRKGAGNIVVHVDGRAAHAGVAPQMGRNAAVELLHQLQRIQAEFPHEGEGVTVNLTVVKSGERTNVIPDSAEATLDVRVRKLEEFDATLSRIKTLGAEVTVSDTKVRAASDGPTYPPLVDEPRAHEMAVEAQHIYAELGKRLVLSGSGGASESGVANSVGIPTLDGLGYVGGDFHTDHEWIDLESVVPRMYLLTRLLMELSAPGPAR